MNNLYTFGVRGVCGSQNVMNPILESKLKKCKTPEEREKLRDVYQITNLLSSIAAIVLGIVLCGVIALFTE